MMRFVLAYLLIAHGVAHAVGFVVPWELVSTPEMPYKTTVFGGMLDAGDVGARALGVVWLMAAVGFVLMGGAVLTGLGARAWLFAIVMLSIGLCAAGWPEARIGLVVNAALLVALFAMPELAAP
jgi:hypothetical protein